MLHTTTDPAMRAGHIASRMEKEHESELIRRGEFPYKDYPTFWLESYDNVLKEMAGNFEILSKDGN